MKKVELLRDKVVFSRLVNAPNPDFTNINQLKIQVCWTYFKIISSTERVDYVTSPNII